MNRIIQSLNLIAAAFFWSSAIVYTDGDIKLSIAFVVVAFVASTLAIILAALRDQFEDKEEGKND